ncbi:MAG TPA: adenosylcobinamide-GDP ribazoletransferase [Euzebyales bacterium]|nr:adenosylcobinamide-GDP ribazoletransferase [Euzebyales bacterium]
MRDSLRLLAVAFGFLTRLPTPRIAVQEGDLTRASALFPLVGLVVAVLAVAADQLIALLLGPIVGAVVGILTATLVTGAFHEDGLADTVDGLWGGWEPAERLRIMRDSRLGTYGTIALIALYALRFALLVPATTRTFAVAMVCAHVLGRAAGPILVMRLPALTDSSSAGIAGRLAPGARFVALILTVVPVAAASGLLALPVLVVAVAVVYASAALYRRRLGGVTGDTIGATTVLVELAVIAVVVASHR